MQTKRMVVAIAMAYPIAFAASAQTATTASITSPDQMAAANVPVKDLGIVTITSPRPTSLPTQIPTTMEGVTREQIENTVNATDSEDALKYFPSLLVRKRYIGDYNHAILSSRASGTGNSARSAVYGDGILLSNYLGNGVGGLSFPPRWGLVTPEEIERVDVMYGPFSAAYPGNSVGAVVDYVTRMPDRFEAHAKADTTWQPFRIYGNATQQTFQAWQTAASLGGKTGGLAWFVNVNHTDSNGQPLTFATRTVSSGTTPTLGNPGIAVTGAVLDRNNTNVPIYVLGTGTQYHTLQDHLKAKVAYDLTPTMRFSYTLGVWQNDSKNTPLTYLRRTSDGAPVYSGTANINGRNFALTAGDFVINREDLTHLMHGVSLKTFARETFDWEVAGSLYDYQKDQKRQNTTALPGATSGGAGTIATGDGTGWNNITLRGTWRPFGYRGTHVVDFGAGQDAYQLKYLTSFITGNWISDAAGPKASHVGGKTDVQNLYAQDAWTISEHWKTVLGLRSEHWKAKDGFTQIATNATNATLLANSKWGERSENVLSPKAALSWQCAPDTVLKTAVGRAIRFPTVAELYGGTSTTNSQYINDPNLKPERSWTGELSLEKDFEKSLLRVTVFAENTHDGLYSQTITDPVANRNISRVQNVGRVETEGLETAFSARDALISGMDFNVSATFTKSIIKENSGFVTTPGDTLGKWQPNIPRWRATALANYHVDEHLSSSLAMRYSGRQFRTLNNADVNGYTYQGVSKYFTLDARVLYKFDRQWTAAFGIDNLNNYKFWNFHPYPQRSLVAELKFDL